MTFQYINTGSGANAGDGDSIRAAFTKVNNNFEQLEMGYAGSGGFGPGYTGSRGYIGYAGSSGAYAGVGYTGSFGNIGYTGSRGVGYTGSTGTIGYTGSIGVGYTGSTGTAATIAVGAVTISTSTASVTNVGTVYNGIFDFVLQRGDLGYTGSSGLSTTSTLINNTATLTLSTSGSLTFTDNTVQTTAFTGTIAYSNVTDVPVLSTSTLINGSYTASLGTTGKLTAIAADGTTTSVSSNLGYVGIPQNTISANRDTRHCDGWRVICPAGKLFFFSLFHCS